MENNNNEMRVQKRNGQLEEISFDKILLRIKKLGAEANIHINSLELGDQDLSNLPLHKDVIEMFPYRYSGFYLCNQSTKEILLSKQ